MPTPQRQLLPKGMNEGLSSPCLGSPSRLTSQASFCLLWGREEPAGELGKGKQHPCVRTVTVKCSARIGDGVWENRGSFESGHQHVLRTYYVPSANVLSFNPQENDVPKSPEGNETETKGNLLKVSCTYMVLWV